MKTEWIVGVLVAVSVVSAFAVAVWTILLLLRKEGAVGQPGEKAPWERAFDDINKSYGVNPSTATLYAAQLSALSLRQLFAGNSQSLPDGEPLTVAADRHLGKGILAKPLPSAAPTGTNAPQVTPPRITLDRVQLRERENYRAAYFHAA